MDSLNIQRQRWLSPATARSRCFRTTSGMTLAEVMIALTVFALVFGSVLTGLTQARYRAIWASLSLEAANFAEQCCEQIQNASWDPTASPAVDQVISNNFPTTTTDLLDYTGGGSLVATNTVRINAMPNTNSPQYKVITCTTVWEYKGRGPFTNSIVTVRAPDQ